MAMLLEGLWIVLLALAGLVTLMVVVAVQRLGRLRWQAVHSRAVARDAMPADIRLVLDRACQELTELGFAYRYSGATSRALVTPRDDALFFDMYQHADGHTHAMVSPSPVPEQHQPCMVQLITCLDNGNNWITLNRCRHFSPLDMPRWQVFDDYLPQWKMAWQRHLERVKAASADICTDGMEVHRRLQRSFEELIPTLAKQGRLLPLDGSPHWRLSRWAALRVAVTVLLGQRRCAWATRGLTPRAAPTTGNADDAAAAQHGLDADLRAYEDQRALVRGAPSSARGKLLTFVVTALLFLLVGGWWMSWTFVPIVLGVVALHEGGHYLAMKLTGYRNVSVFFLPGLGGLATGEKATATPFEKLLVYLAGPVPGIALAGIAFWVSAAGYWTGPAWLNQFLIASLAINYLNLLPIMPLDGGRVLEVLVFARHPRLRFAFAAACCGLLFGLGALLGDTVLRVIAVLIGVGLPYQWRRMQLDQMVPRDGRAALGEPQALQRIFTALQHAKFQAWSFAKRSAAATALLPELLGRRASATEAVGGVLIYTACLLGPIGAAWVAVPQLGSVLSLLGPALRVPADDVDPASPRPPKTAPPDWNAKLAQAATLSPDERLVAYLGAAQQADDGEDTETAQRHYQAAWTLAQTLPTRDLRRMDTLQGLASVAEDEAQRRAYLTQVVSDLHQPVGPERERVAQAKEQLSYGELPAAQRVGLLREALELRTATATSPDYVMATTRLSLARALDENADSAGAEAQLRTRTDSVPLPAPQERTREALNRRVQRVLTRVDLAWFLIAHGRATDAQQMAAQALREVPAKVTTSWMPPRQQALEAQLWAQLLAQDTSGLAAHWQAYDAAQQGGFGGDRKLLVHEADRALVAQALRDRPMQAQARAGIDEALSKMTRQPTMLCKPPSDNRHANWHAGQQAARRRILTDLGACGRSDEHAAGDLNALGIDPAAARTHQ